MDFRISLIPIVKIEGMDCSLILLKKSTAVIIKCRTIDILELSDSSFYQSF
jgi:hypothetical protein